MTEPPAARGPVDERAMRELAGLLEQGGALVLSGAGLSTDSGIPDYRGPTGARRTQAPMTYQAFTRDPVARHRYWARSHVGWRHIARADPNAGHRAVADLQASGLLVGIVTQNVDGLHQAAGARDVVELHGSLDRVVCLHCRALSDRGELADRLHAANPRFDAVATRINPDGDAELPDEALAGFVMVPCAVCGTDALKPDVVYFGEPVPKDRVARSFALTDAARSVLVLGSSLTVMSGYRFVLRAAARGRPVAIVNQGVTRGDDRADVRIDAPLGQVLPDLAARVGATWPQRG